MPLPDDAKHRLATWFSQDELDGFRYTDRGPIAWAFEHVLKQGAVTWNGVVNFARDPYDPESASGLALIAHEMLHVRQQKDAGWWRFLARYVWLLRRSGYRGKNNRHHPLEAPAYALQREVREALPGDG